MDAFLCNNLLTWLETAETQLRKSDMVSGNLL